MRRPIVLDERPLGERLEARSKARQDRLQWIKDRALEYVDAGDLRQAMASFFSDVGKDWPEVEGPIIDPDVYREMRPLALHHVLYEETASMRAWIEGWN